MDIDTALNELGMLSSVTESRKQYLQEKNRTHSEPSLKDASSMQRKSKVFQVIRIDPTYVRGFSFNSSPIYDNSGRSDETLGSESNFDFGSNYRNSENDFEKEARLKRLSRFRLGRMRRYRKPYEVPWRLYNSCHEMDMSFEGLSICNSPSRQQSKSNSTTPVKSNAKPNGTTLLPRSRSLNNLDLAKLKLTDIFDSPSTSSVVKQDIENVSREMKNMHMTE